MALPEILPISKVDPTAIKNPRERRGTTATAELRQSIKDRGQLQPVIVGMTPGADGRYPLLAGWGRYEALISLGAKDIKVTYTADVKKARLTALAENEHRSPLHTSELVGAVGEMSAAEGVKQKEIARELVKSEGYISQMLAVYHSPVFGPWKKVIAETEDDALRTRLPQWNDVRAMVYEYSEKGKPDMSPEERQKRMVSKFERMVERAKEAKPEPGENENDGPVVQEGKKKGTKLPKRIAEWYKEAKKTQKSGVFAADGEKLSVDEMHKLNGAIEALDWAFKLKKTATPPVFDLSDVEDDDSDE